MKTTGPLTGMLPLSGSKAVVMERALAAAGISIVYQDSALGMLYAENLPQHFQKTFREGGSDAELFGDEHGHYLNGLKRDILETGIATTAEIDVSVEGEVRSYRLQMERIGEPNDYGLLSVVSEVTDTRHREKVLKSLLRELSHRSKNLLAIIQGIATQTARNTISLDTFLVKFRGRLQSLSHSQDLITDSSWRGAYLFELAQKQFAPYWPETSGSMPISGLNAHLTPNAAVHIGLALHELIVNSASHGAIATGAAAITLDCKEAELSGRRAVEVAWIEIVPDNADLAEFTDNAFGKTVLERVVPASMNGKANLSLGDGRIEYHLIVPETEFEILKR